LAHQVKGSGLRNFGVNFVDKAHDKARDKDCAAAFSLRFGDFRASWLRQEGSKSFSKLQRSALNVQRSVRPLAARGRQLDQDRRNA
jgi:hypothetical protein